MRDRIAEIKIKQLKNLGFKIGLPTLLISGCLLLIDFAILAILQREGNLQKYRGKYLLDALIILLFPVTFFVLLGTFLILMSIDSEAARSTARSIQAFKNNLFHAMNLSAQRIKNSITSSRQAFVHQISTCCFRPSKEEIPLLRQNTQ